MNLWFSFHFFLQSCHSLDVFFFYDCCWFIQMSDTLVLLIYIPSLSLPSGRILAFWKKSYNLIYCFFLLVSSGDDGIFLLFLGELIFRSKLDFLWLFVILTHLSVCCLIGFLLPFLQFPVTGSIESSVSSLSLLRWYLLFPIVLVSCVQFVLLCEMFHTPCIFSKSGKTVLIAGCEKHHFSSLYFSWLCPFFSINNWARLMLLTKHVIHLNHYHCGNAPLYGHIV